MKSWMIKIAGIALAVSLLFIFKSTGTFAEMSRNVMLSENQVPEGLTELYYEGNTLSGTFSFDGTQIFVETRRGSRTPKAVRDTDPNAPQYEVDIRLLDENGVPFFVQVGGHGPIDSSWVSSFDPLLYGAEISTEQRNEKEARSQKAFGNATRMIEALRVVKFRRNLVPEYKAILNILPIIESGKMITKLEEGNSKSSIGPLVSSDKHLIEIWKKGAFFGRNIWADHSGTVAKVIFSGGGVYQIWSACNHGACPGSDMSFKCASVFYDRVGFCQAPPMCSTQYGFSNGKHVCNDDTYIQYYRIKYNSDISTIGGTCSDSSLRTKAPDCW